MIKKLKYFLYYLDRYNVIHIDDKKYLQLLYEKIFQKKLDLKKAKSFNEKIQWLKLYDRKEIYTTMVDKYEAKKYVEKKIGNKYIIPSLGVYDKFEVIKFDELPNSFVIKSTHDSGGIVIVKNKTLVNIQKIKEMLNNHLRRNYYYAGREWPYKNVVPRILIEKYMGENLNDYKIFCFNGEPKFTLVCSNRKGEHKNTDFYDNNWNLLPFTREKHENNPKGIEKPKNLDEMLKIARDLSKDIPFIRVDLYEINNRIYFGELTFYPSSGFEGFNPPEWDMKLGDMIQLPIDK